MTADPERPPVLDLFAAVYLRLWALANHPEVQEAQFQPGRSAVPREDTIERSKSLTNDPTPNIVIDTRRVKLRAAVLESEKALSDAHRVLRIAEAKLVRALDQENNRAS